MTVEVDVPTSVYLYYDRYEVLIYVGITSRGIGRNREHNTSKAWWPHVTRQEVEHYPNRALAHDREVELIFEFTPPFNVQHNPNHRSMKAAYQTMVELSAGINAEKLVRSLNKRIPIEVIEQDRNECVYSTYVDHACIAIKLFENTTRHVKVIQDTERVGHVTRFARHGPFVFLHTKIRTGVESGDAVLDLNITVGRQVTFQPRRIRLGVLVR